MISTYYSIFLSDLHIGTKYCKADKLLSFFDKNRADNWFLIGDIIDTWNLGPNWYMDESQELVIAYIKVLSKTSNLTILSGNHDEANITKLVNTFPSAHIIEACNYLTLKKRKLLIAHGHQFDASWIKASSDFHFSMAMVINRWYHSSSKFKSKIGGIAYKLFGNPRMSKFYRNITKALEMEKYAGCIVGHIHKPEIKSLSYNITYYNTGDWVSNCTAIAETLDGDMKLISWLNQK